MITRRTFVQAIGVVPLVVALPAIAGSIPSDARSPRGDFSYVEVGELPLDWNGHEVAYPWTDIEIEDAGGVRNPLLNVLPSNRYAYRMVDARNGRAIRYLTDDEWNLGIFEREGVVFPFDTDVGAWLVDEPADLVLWRRDGWRDHHA